MAEREEGIPRIGQKLPACVICQAAGPSKMVGAWGGVPRPRAIRLNVPGLFCFAISKRFAHPPDAPDSLHCA